MYNGLTFNNLRKALYYIYYGSGLKAIDPDDADAIEAYENACYEYIIPMQQNFFNPIKELGKDTYIQFFIDRDARLTQDQFGNATNFTYKLADISLRFIGVNAEDWAKAFHHLTKRKDIYNIFFGTCQGNALEAIGDIIPTSVPFFGKNFNIAFDVQFRLQYVESMDIGWTELETVSLAHGTVN